MAAISYVDFINDILSYYPRIKMKEVLQKIETKLNFIFAWLLYKSLKANHEKFHLLVNI